MCGRGVRRERHPGGRGGSLGMAAAGFMARKNRRVRAVKYHFIASPGGGHIQMCLRAEQLRDHTRKKKKEIDN